MHQRRVAVVVACALVGARARRFIRGASRVGNANIGCVAASSSTDLRCGTRATIHRAAVVACIYACIRGHGTVAAHARAHHADSAHAAIGARGAWTACGRCGAVTLCGGGCEQSKADDASKARKRVARRHSGRVVHEGRLANRRKCFTKMRGTNVKRWVRLARAYEGDDAPCHVYERAAAWFAVAAAALGPKIRS